eukprot:5984131-Alexandrium_andersonii.AAC.1
MHALSLQVCAPRGGAAFMRSSGDRMQSAVAGIGSAENELTSATRQRQEQVEVTDERLELHGSR